MICGVRRDTLGGKPVEEQEGRSWHKLANIFVGPWKRASGTYKKPHFGKPVRAQEGRSRRTGSKEGSGKAPGKEHLCRSLESCVQGPTKNSFWEASWHKFRVEGARLFFRSRGAHPIAGVCSLEAPP